MNETDHLSSGHVFGRYRIVRLIGEGGMGAVYEALHPTLKKRVAIKTLLPAHARKDEARARFLREAEAASSINHPNVVNVSDVGMEGDLPYMVMELLEGQTLGDLLTERGALPPEQAVALLLPAMAAVAAGHERGAIHRDLKPHNIFLARGRRGEIVPKVLDFGVSKVTTDDVLLTGTMTVLGTAAYMSPEQARGAKGVDFLSDQYSLGLILFEMLTGARAHPGDSALEVLHNVALGLITPARELKPELDPDLDAVLTRMLATASAGRYPSLHDAGRALLPFADETARVAMAGEFVAPGAATAAASTRAAAQGSAHEAAPAGTGARAGGAATAEPAMLERTRGGPPSKPSSGSSSGASSERTWDEPA
jgi:serine/threonine protein kinase